MSRTPSLLAPLSSAHIALFLFLLAIYLLTYTPRINSSDGLAMFATAESLARRGALDIEQIRWLGLQQGAFGLDGLLYSRKGIGVPVGLLPLTWLGLATPWFGPVGASLLFNAIVTALTAVLLSAYLRALNFSRRTGILVALIFGLATLAWPYAKSLFSDPFSGLLLLATALALLKFKQRTGAEKQRSSGAKLFSPALTYPLLAGLLLGWNIATRYAEALFVPVFGLLLLYYLFTIYNLQFTIYDSKLAIPPLLAFTTPLVIIGLGLLAFNLSRYGDPLNTGYLPNETFSAIWWEGVLGQLLSPGRGLLLYCPVLILSLWGIAPFFRRFPAEAIAALSVILIHLLLYGKWFMWHGGYAWGPRFMVPTLPFWALFLAPVVEQILHESSGRRSVVGSRLFRVALLLLVAFSLVPQLLAVAIDFAPFQNTLLDTGLPLFARQTFFDPQYAALLGAWRFISLDTLDLAWAWQGQINWGLLAVLVLNVVIAGFWLGKSVIREARLDPADGPGHTPNSPAPNQSRNSFFSILPLLATLIAIIFLLAHVHALPPQPLQQAVAQLNQLARPADAIITNTPEQTTDFAELYKGRAPMLGLNNGGFPLPSDVTQRVNNTLAGHSQIWWLPNWLPPQESAIEQMLLTHNIRVFNENFEGQRLALFVQPPPAQAATFNPSLTLGQQIKLLQATYPPQTQSRAALPVEFQWQAVAPIDHNYHVFIHLLNAEGRPVAQADGQPAQWTRPTSTWAGGETIIDRHALWIPGDAPAGAYTLRVGLYQPATGQRLLLPNGQDSVEFDLQIQ